MEENTNIPVEETPVAPVPAESSADELKEVVEA